MILTTCAACAAPLAHDAPTRCVRCRTRYCSTTCLNNHAHREGHSEEICAERARAGGAEQYHANQKYMEAVAVAVAKCADDTKGQLHGPVLYFITRTVLQRNVEEDALLAAALVLVPDLRLYEASTASMASRWRRVDGVSAAARRWRIGGSAAAARRWRRGEALTRGRKPRDRPDGVVAAPPPRRHRRAAKRNAAAYE